MHSFLICPPARMENLAIFRNRPSAPRLLGSLEKGKYSNPIQLGNFSSPNRIEVCTRAVMRHGRSRAGPIFRSDLVSPVVAEHPRFGFQIASLHCSTR